MRILYIHQYFCTRQGRSGTRSYEFSKLLLQRGHRVTMLTSTSELSDVQVPPGKRVHRLCVEGIDVIAVRIPYSQSMGPLRRIWSFLQFMLHSTWIACRSSKHDVVFATSTPLTVGVPGLCASLVRRIPLVFEVRDLWPEAPIQMGIIRNPWIIQLLRFFERLVYRRSARVVALSPGMQAGILATGVPAAKVTVIPNCSDLDLFRPLPPDPDDSRRLGFEGRFVAVHAGSMGAANGLDVLVDAAKKLRRHEDVLVVLLGQGSQAGRLQERFESMGLTNVRCLGSVPRAQVPEYLRASHVCLVLFRDLPVLGTNSPNKLFDALAAGRPVVVNSDGWTRELVERFEIGRAAHPGSGEDLAEQILWLKEHSEARARMSGNARRLAESHFDRLRLVKELELVLQRAVDGETLPAAASEPGVREAQEEAATASTSNGATTGEHGAVGNETPPALVHRTTGPYTG
jgi:glycosyltransferase involved in cell wall biosynthesis